MTEKKTQSNHLGSGLSKYEWEKLRQEAVARWTDWSNKAAVQAASRIRHIPGPDEVLNTLVNQAKTDKGYAYWLAHVYADTHTNMRDMPARLAAAFKGRHAQSG